MPRPKDVVPIETEERLLERTREKFDELLDVDRTSPAFDRLFVEVDRMLAALVELERRGEDAGAARASPVLWDPSGVRGGGLR